MAQPYLWVDLADLAEEGFFDMIAEEGYENLRLEVHPGDDRPYKLVEIETGEACGDYDASHTCPPSCP